jgi:hypothetical protein
MAVNRSMPEHGDTVMLERDEQGRLVIPAAFHRPRRALPSGIGKEWVEVFEQVWYRLSLVEWRDHLLRAVGRGDLVEQVEGELARTPDLTAKEVPAAVMRVLMDAWFGPPRPSIWDVLARARGSCSKTEIDGRVDSIRGSWG